jgi:hypothetical protein
MESSGTALRYTSYIIYSTYRLVSVNVDSSYCLTVGRKHPKVLHRCHVCNCKDCIEQFEFFQSRAKIITQTNFLALLSLATFNVKRNIVTVTLKGPIPLDKDTTSCCRVFGVDC